MILVSLIIVSPILMMILGSLKTPAEAALSTLALPKVWKFDNYVFVFKSGGVFRAMGNSIFITAIATFFVIIASAMTAFLLARKNSRGIGLLYNYFYLGMIAPMQVITTFGLLKLMGIIGSFISVILIYIAINTSFCIFVFTGFIKGIPKDMDEAAYIDGAGPLRMFISVILPLLKPILFTNVTIMAMSIWNDFQIPIYFLNSSKKWTMPLTVFNFYGQYFSSWNLVYADLVLTALPVTILYLFCQKYILEGMTAGAVKG